MNGLKTHGRPSGQLPFTGVSVNHEIIRGDIVRDESGILSRITSSEKGQARMVSGGSTFNSVT